MARMRSIYKHVLTSGDLNKEVVVLWCFLFSLIIELW